MLRKVSSFELADRLEFALNLGIEKGYFQPSKIDYWSTRFSEQVGGREQLRTLVANFEGTIRSYVNMSEEAQSNRLKEMLAGAEELAYTPRKEPVVIDLSSDERKEWVPTKGWCIPKARSDQKPRRRFNFDDDR